MFRLGVMVYEITANSLLFVSSQAHFYDTKTEKKKKNGKLLYNSAMIKFEIRNIKFLSIFEI